MAEIKRKNGYYFCEERNAYYPGATTVLSSAGSSYGLEQWKIKQASQAIIFALRGLATHDSLKERLESATCLNWACEVGLAGPSLEGKRVQDFGTDCHSGFEGFLNGKGFTSENPDVEIALNTFREFYKDSGLEVIGLEEQVTSHVLRVCGRFDVCFRLNESSIKHLTPYLSKNSDPLVPGFVMSDFKTGSIYEPKMTAQLAIYRQGLLESRGIDCSSGLIINIERENPSQIKLYNYGALKLERALEGAKAAIKCWEYFDAPQWYHKQFTAVDKPVEKLKTRKLVTVK